MSAYTHYKLGNVKLSLLPPLLLGSCTLYSNNNILYNWFFIGLGSYMGASFAISLTENQQRAIFAGVLGSLAIFIKIKAKK